jgi:hypothetical protein
MKCVRVSALASVLALAGFDRIQAQEANESAKAVFRVCEESLARIRQSLWYAEKWHKCKREFVPQSQFTIHSYETDL